MILEIWEGNESSLEKGDCCKYGLEEGGWCSKEVGERHGVGVRKATRNGWEAFKDELIFKLA